VRVAVIGCGIVGCCVGWQLARRGADVVLVDPAEPGTGVTGWSFAWANASSVTDDRPYFDLRVAGLDAWRRLAGEIGGGWWHQTGHLRWGDDPAGAVALVDRLRAWGYPAELTGLAALEPAVRCPAPAAYCPEEAWVSARAVAGRLTLGMERRTDTLVDITVRCDQVTGAVLASGGRLAVDAVVNAAGPDGHQVARLVGRDLPLREDPGFLARVRCRPVPIGRAMHTPHVELRPDGDDRVALHSREVDALIGSTASLFDELQQRAIDTVPALSAAALIEGRVARRPMPADERPSVGIAGPVDGYYEAVTHSGVTLAAIIGEVLAAEILDGGVDPLVAPYRPARFC
jgi:glycine/D-amino acid oxidase-like deaminating enzyme